MVDTPPLYDQKTCRVYKTFGKTSYRRGEYLKHIVTSNERWMHNCPQSLSKQAWSGENPEQKHCGKPTTVFLLGKFLLYFSGFQKHIVHCSRSWLFDEKDMAIQSAILMYENARPQLVASTQKKLDNIHWKTLQHPPSSAGLTTCGLYFLPTQRRTGNPSVRRRRRYRNVYARSVKGG